MRRPDFWIEKFYSQRIANIEHKETRSFEAFLNQTHIETYLYNRHRMFSWWAKAFGPDAVEILPYEPAVPGFDLIGQFLTASGINPGPAHNLILRNSKANRTLSTENAEILRRKLAANAHVDSRLVRDLKRKPENGGGYLSDDARAGIVARAAPDMARICEDFVRDGREVLFPISPERISALAKSG